MRKLDPRLKICFLLISILLIIFMSNPVSLTEAAIVTLILMAVSGEGSKDYFLNGKYLLGILFVIYIVVAILDSPGRAASGFIKWLLVILIFELYLKTTNQVDILDGVAEAFGLRAGPARMIYLILDFPHQFILQMGRVRRATLARSGNVSGTGFSTFLKQVGLVVPALRSTGIYMQRTRKSMDDRCYDSTSRRVRVSPLSFGRREYIAIALFILYMALLIVTEIMWRRMI